MPNQHNAGCAEAKMIPFAAMKEELKTMLPLLVAYVVILVAVALMIVIAVVK